MWISLKIDQRPWVCRLKGEEQAANEEQKLCD